MSNFLTINFMILYTNYRQWMIPHEWHLLFSWKIYFGRNTFNKSFNSARRIVFKIWLYLKNWRVSTLLDVALRIHYFPFRWVFQWRFFFCCKSKHTRQFPLGKQPTFVPNIHTVLLSKEMHAFQFFNQHRSEAPANIMFIHNSNTLLTDWHVCRKKLRGISEVRHHG